MTDIILHHYEISPYSEKVRIGLGLKWLGMGIGGGPRDYAKTRPAATPSGRISNVRLARGCEQN